MKVLAPRVTCIVASHMKPYLRDSLNSLLQQTRLDIQIIVVDSGQWHRRVTDVDKEMGKIYDDFASHPLIEWYSTGETGDLRQHKCPIGWATNEIIRAGVIRGRYVCTFYDDDVYHPAYMERMAGYLDDHPHIRAVWCSQERMQLKADGSMIPHGAIIATGVKYGAQFDQVVDGTQVMFHRTLLDAMPDPWLTENPDDAECRHSDGLFLDKISVLAGEVPNIPEVLVRHRFTPISAYSPMH